MDIETVDVERSVSLDNLVYRAKVMSGGIHLDGYYVVLLRYTYAAKTRRPLESHYWTPDGEWIKFPIGGESQPIPVPFFDWPQTARELVQHVAEPEAAKVLTDVINAAEEERARKSG